MRSNPAKPSGAPRVDPPDLSEHSADRDLAIIGVTGRYPGASTVEELWQHLVEGRDAITEIPRQRWDQSQFYSERKAEPGKSYCKWGGFLESVEEFDAPFFNIAPRLASYVDPKSRLFLETVWELLEQSGYTRGSLKRLYASQVGVFVGAMYQLYGRHAGDEVEEAATALSSYNEIANRVSYFFDLRGPSLAVDTMCSSSLAAVDLACQSLLSGACRVAIAGGVNLSIHPQKYVGLSQAQLVGSHAGSRSFSAGDGFLPAEAVGAVLLKRLRQAQEEGDRVLGVIKSSLSNHSGHSSGFHAPNAEAQEQLIEENIRRSGIDARTISYVESAASGASLGDALEIRALSRVFAGLGVSRQSCAIGTVKSNIGHAEAASGIAQLTKVILQLQHRQLVPSIGARPLNPQIDFAQTPFYLLTQAQPWKPASAHSTEAPVPLRATVSSFGAGGSNTHLILEESPAEPLESEEWGEASGMASERREIIVLSGRTPQVLCAMAQRLLSHLREQERTPHWRDRGRMRLADIAYTLQSGREEMVCRLGFLAGSVAELLSGLEQHLRRSAAESAAGPGDASSGGPVIYQGDTERHAQIKQLLSGRAGEALVQVFLAQGELEKLVLHWVQGGTVPWEKLHEGRRLRKVFLPTYPFCRTRYWLSGAPVVAIRADARPDLVQFEEQSEAPDYGMTADARSTQTVLR